MSKIKELINNTKRLKAINLRNLKRAKTRVDKINQIPSKKLPTNLRDAKREATNVIVKIELHLKALDSHLNKLESIDKRVSNGTELGTLKPEIGLAIARQQALESKTLANEKLVRESSTQIEREVSRLEAKTEQKVEPPREEKGPRQEAKKSETTAKTTATKKNQEEKGPHQEAKKSETTATKKNQGTQVKAKNPENIRLKLTEVKEEINSLKIGTGRAKAKRDLSATNEAIRDVENKLEKIAVTKIVTKEQKKRFDKLEKNLDQLEKLRTLIQKRDTLNNELKNIEKIPFEPDTDTDTDTDTDRDTDELELIKKTN